MNLAFPMAVIDFAQCGEPRGGEIVRTANRLGGGDGAFHVAAKGGVDFRIRQAFAECGGLRAAGIGKLRIARTGEAVGVAGGGAAMTDQENAGECWGHARNVSDELAGLQRQVQGVDLFLGKANRHISLPVSLHGGVIHGLGLLRGIAGF